MIPLLWSWGWPGSDLHSSLDTTSWGEGSTVFGDLHSGHRPCLPMFSFPENFRFYSAPSPSRSLNPHASLHLPGQWLVWPRKLIPEQGCPYQATGSLSPSSPPWILSSLVSKEPAHTSPKLFPSFSLTALQAPETNVPKDKQTFSKVVLFCLTPCEFIFCHFFY